MHLKWTPYNIPSLYQLNDYLCYIIAANSQLHTTSTRISQTTLDYFLLFIIDFFFDFCFVEIWINANDLWWRTLVRFPFCSRPNLKLWNYHLIHTCFIGGTSAIINNLNLVVWAGRWLSNDPEFDIIVKYPEENETSAKNVLNKMKCIRFQVIWILLEWSTYLVHGMSI